MNRLTPTQEQCHFDYPAGMVVCWSPGGDFWSGELKVQGSGLTRDEAYEDMLDALAERQEN